MGRAVCSGIRRTSGVVIVDPLRIYRYRGPRCRGWAAASHPAAPRPREFDCRSRCGAVRSRGSAGKTENKKIFSPRPRANEPVRSPDTPRPSGHASVHTYDGPQSGNPPRGPRPAPDAHGPPQRRRKYASSMTHGDQRSARAHSTCSARALAWYEAYGHAATLCSNSTRKPRSIVPMVHALHKYQSHTPQSGARPSVRHPRRPFMCAAVRPAAAAGRTRRTPRSAQSLAVVAPVDGLFEVLEKVVDVLEPD